MTRSEGGWLSPDTLAAPTGDARYDVFLSFTWADAITVERIVQALLAGGLTVFRDRSGIDEFDGITPSLIEGLSASKVVLAYYSRRYPTRPACQWELTAALVAAHLDGDPLRRVLVINPETDSDHVAPVQLEDARYFADPGADSDLGHLVDRVRDRVRSIDVPLGMLQACKPVRPAFERPASFVGRFRELWEIDSALHTDKYPATRRPDGNRAVLLHGIGGIGKTSLARQYAALFTGAFPGGVHWLGPVADEDSNPEEAMRRFDASLRGLAAERGLPVQGELTALSRALAGELTQAGQDVLIVVDDVPAGLGVGQLNSMLLRSPYVRTLVTSRGGCAAWPVAEVALDGLDEADGRALFGAVGPPGDALDPGLLDSLVHRCGGHPVAIRVLATNARSGRGLVSDDELLADVSAGAEEVARLLIRDLEQRGEVAMRIVRLATVLANAPVPASLLAAVVNLSDLDALREALNDLAQSGLARLDRVGWVVHPLVGKAAQTLARQDDNDEFAERASCALLDGIARQDGGDPADDFLIAEPVLRIHAATLGSRDDVPVAHRLELLRWAASGHEAAGEVPLAAARMDDVLALRPDDAGDLIAAARLKIVIGHYGEAFAHADRVIGAADPGIDRRTAYWAEFLAAQALDLSGDHARAEQVFWRDPVALDRSPPDWLDARERLQFHVARARGLRLRGRLRLALELLRSLRHELIPGAVEDRVVEPLPTGRLELAKAQLLTGNVKAARHTAAELAADYRAAGLGKGPQCLEVLGLQAEATLAIDFTEFHTRPGEWAASEERLRRLHGDHMEQFGEHNPLTLAVAVCRDRALVSLGKPEEGIRALEVTEQDIIHHLGTDHPLRFRTRYAIGQAYAQLRQFTRQRDMLADLLQQQTTAQGKHHPDTLETMLDLGIAFAIAGERDRGRALVDEASHGLREIATWKSEVQLRTNVAQALLRLLPQSAITTVMAAENLLSGKGIPPDLLEKFSERPPNLGAVVERVVSSSVVRDVVDLFFGKRNRQSDDDQHDQPGGNP